LKTLVVRVTAIFRLLLFVDLSCQLHLNRGLASVLYEPRGKNISLTLAAIIGMDAAAMRALIQAFRAQPMSSRVFLNDETLIHEGLCQAVAGHNNHAHFEIKPPVRVMPS